MRENLTHGSRGRREATRCRWPPGPMAGKPSAYPTSLPVDQYSGDGNKTCFNAVEAEPAVSAACRSAHYRASGEIVRKPAPAHRQKILHWRLVPLGANGMKLPILARTCGGAMVRFRRAWGDLTRST